MWILQWNKCQVSLQNEVLKICFVVLVLIIFKNRTPCSVFLFFLLRPLKRSPMPSFSHSCRWDKHLVGGFLCSHWTGELTRGYSSSLTKQLCWTGFKTGSQLSVPDLTRVKDHKTPFWPYSEWRAVKSFKSDGNLVPSLFLARSDPTGSDVCIYLPSCFGSNI